MRVIFINLHDTNFLVKPFWSLILRHKVRTFKHKFLLDYAVQHNIKVFDYVLCSRCTTKFQRIRNFFKALFVIRFNGYKHGQIDITEHINADDCIIAYSHYDEQLDIFPLIQATKVVMGNHFIRIGKNTNLSQLGVSYYANEIDVTKNAFVQKHYDLSDVHPILMPYVPASRFHRSRPFNGRKNKAMAIGTLSTVHGVSGYDEYVEFAKTEWVQPMRKEILDRRKEIQSWLDSYISYIHEDKTYEVNAGDSRIRKFFKKVYNRIFGGRQSKYTSFDMVEKFNEYKMVVCPEELVGVPGIGFVEGMACGCAYIGLDHSMYRDLGLVPGVHYISYDGTLEGLKSVVQYYQNHNEELETIANRGYEFVNKNFNHQKIAQNFFETILNKQKL